MTHPPHDGDIQVAKRELLKIGVDQGFVTRSQIAEHLPLIYLSDSEMEMLRFTFESMNIKVLERAPSKSASDEDPTES